MSRTATAIALLALSLWLSGARALADEPVSASLNVDRNVITIGDQIRVVITVTAQPGYRLGAPVVLSTLGDFDVVDSAPPLLANPTGGGTRYTFRYWITTFTLGDHVIPAVEFPYANEQGATASVRTTPIAVRVQSVIRDGEAVADIKPLKPQLDLPGAETSRIVFWASAVAITAIVAIPAVVLYRRRRRRRATGIAVGETPVQEALRELLHIAELRLPEKGRTEEHYRLVAAALRRYLAQQFALPADRRTARELRVAMDRAGIDRRQTEALYELLRESEAVRFQRAQRQPRHAQQTLADAINAIGKARAAQRRTAELVP
ncbi:MAG TPA: BatD family protein [Candidatus Dormibacteraeota bacterium]|nr:BatD family protein [Candidatus Dormibacteraeota bacterium]